MKAIFAALLIAATAACGGRQVEVNTAPAQAAAVSVRLTNNSTQAVNVSIVNGGSELFLRQVAARATETMPVQGVASGASVTLRATTVDGSRTYSKENVVLSGTYDWTVP